MRTILSQELSGCWKMTVEGVALQLALVAVVHCLMMVIAMFTVFALAHRKSKLISNSSNQTAI
jgi:hypothetical protein